MKRFVLFLSFMVFSSLTYCQGSKIFGSAKNIPEHYLNMQDTTEILLIGSSYFNYNNLSQLLIGLANGSNTKVHIEMYGQNGLYLSDHASSEGTEAKINERDWDAVVLQGVGVLVAYPDSFTNHPVYPSLITLRNKIHANCSTTRMIFCMPWAFEDGMTWYQNWTDTYEDMQLLIYNNTLQYSNEIEFEIAPVGWAWYAVLKEYNYPLHYLHLSDWNHPSLRGSYLMACTIYSTIFLQSSVDNPFNAGLPLEDVYYFQAVASDTVLNNLYLWNITQTVAIDKWEISNLEHNLDQNFPNPASTSTTINYSVPRNHLVRIDVYNGKGKIISTPINQIQLAGEYSIKIDLSDYLPGIYFYSLTAEGTKLSKRMIVIN